MTRPIFVLRARPAVRFDHIRPAGFKILSALDQAATACGLNLELTSGTDSHQSPDPHCLGEAYDCSVTGLAPEQISALVSSLRVALGPLFTVLYETPTKPTGILADLATVNARATGAHIHIQRKKNTVYPPAVTA